MEDNRSFRRRRVAMALAAAVAMPVPLFIGTAAGAAAGDQGCVAGTWTYDDAEGFNHPAAMWTAEVRDPDTGAVLNSQLTDDQGQFRLCLDVDGAATGRDVTVTFSANSGRWSVGSAPRNPYLFPMGEALVVNVTGGNTNDLGVLKPDQEAYKPVAVVFEVVRRTWALVGAPNGSWDIHGDGQSVRVVWKPTLKQGSAWQASSRAVVLDASAASVPETIVHEVTHAVMWDAYGEPDYASDEETSCPGGSHSTRIASNAYCAWREGFATWFPAVVLDDTVFTTPQGNTYDIESALWVAAGTEAWTGWGDGSEGDAVEGRVAAALRDLSDGMEEEGDKVADDWTMIWDVMQSANPMTFEEFWNEYAARYKTDETARQDALDTLAFNTINY